MILATIISSSLLIFLIIFQMLLILGLPLGHFAWGGQHKILPRKLKVGSAISIGIYTFFSLLILSKANIWQVFPQGSFLNISLWVIAIYLTAGVIMNAISRSKPERYTMTPVALTLAICLFIIASY